MQLSEGEVNFCQYTFPPINILTNFHCQIVLSPNHISSIFNSAKKYFYIFETYFRVVYLHVATQQDPY
jgi:hypothetical protein